jgi:hypothetical protein
VPRPRRQCTTHVNDNDDRRRSPEDDTDDDKDDGDGDKVQRLLPAECHELASFLRRRRRQFTGAVETNA